MAITVSPALAKAWGLKNDPVLDRVVRYRVLRGFCIGNGMDVQPGDEVDLPEYRARGFIAHGKLAAIRRVTNADPVLEKADPPQESGDDPLDSADPGLDAGDPLLSQRGVKRRR